MLVRRRRNPLLWQPVHSPSCRYPEEGTGRWLGGESCEQEVLRAGDGRGCVVGPRRPPAARRWRSQNSQRKGPEMMPPSCMPALFRRRQVTKRLHSVGQRHFGYNCDMRAVSMLGVSQSLLFVDRTRGTKRTARAATIRRAARASAGSEDDARSTLSRTDTRWESVRRLNADVPGRKGFIRPS